MPAPRASAVSFGSFGSSYGSAPPPASTSTSTAAAAAAAAAAAGARRDGVGRDEKPKLMSFADLNAVSGWDGQPVHDETVSTAGGGTVDDDDEEEDDEVGCEPYLRLCVRARVCGVWCA